MTDTDDTDDLLLIPPDFFAIESESEHSNIDPYYSIVDSLIEQVGNLQNRIKSIESYESFLNHTFDSSPGKKTKMQKHIREFRKYNSSDDLYIPSSTQSTPQKPHTKFKLNSLPASPYVDKFNTNRNIPEFTSLAASPNKSKQSPSSSDIKGDCTTINEVDNFLSKVKTIRRLNAAKNLENEFNFNKTIPSTKSKSKVPEAFNGDSQVVMPKAQNEILEPLMTKVKTWQSGDHREIPEYSFAIYEQQKDNSICNENPYKFQSQDQKYFHKEFPNMSSIANDSVTSTDRFLDSGSSTSDSISQVTTFRNYNKSELLNDPIHTNALNILNMHRQLTENNVKKVSKNQQRSHIPNHSAVNNNLGLLNLADMWNTTSSQLLHLNSSQLLQKLQEEKLRRQHCEDLIQDLQNKNLELQQKLTVAIKVDESKNEAIGKFQDTLQKLMSKMQTLHKEKREWENDKSRLKTRHSNEIKESIEKIQYYEKEVSKALNIAHANHEKMILLEKNSSDLQNENQSMKKSLKDLEDLLLLERSRNKEFSENVKSKELELVQIKETLNMARCEIDKTNKTIASYQEEFSKLTDEKDRLQDDLRSKNAKVLHYEEDRKQLVRESEESRKRENKLKEELVAVKKLVDQNKMDLRNFYQGQVELLVQNKLKEFQSQLDKSENNFREEIRKREISIAKTAAVHIQQLSEKYSIEIKLLEKKHQEEAKLYEVQIMQYKEQIEDLQTKLNNFQEKRVTIAKQLQKIMETQWSEALRIIASGKSPTFNNEESFNTVDQLNSLTTKSYNNLEEILTKHVNEHFNIDKNSKGTISNEEERNQKDELKFSMETPVSSRTQGNRQYNEHEVQKYINLLLNRPTSEGPSREPDIGLDYDQISWSNDQTDGNRTTKQSQKDKKFHKPPWK